nr:hypothetical protein [Tanacetum cinerariifolium]
MEILLELTSNKLLVGTKLVLQPRSSEVGFINHMLILKLSKSKDEGSRSRSQSMNDQSYYKQAKTKTMIKQGNLLQECYRSYKNVNIKYEVLHIKKASTTKEFEERDLNIGGDC